MFEEKLEMLIKKKLPGVNGLVITTVFNTTIGEVEKKIPDRSDLVTTSVLNTKTEEVENKNIGYWDKVFYYFWLNLEKTNDKLIKKKILDIKIKEKGLNDKSDVSNSVKTSDLITIFAELKAEQDKITKLHAFDSSCFRGKIHFEDNGTQNYLVFLLVSRYFKPVSNRCLKNFWSVFFRIWTEL